MKKLLISGVLLIGTMVFTPAIAAVNSDECYNCSTFQTRTLANQFASTVFRDTEYFVLDRANVRLSKFVIIRNPLLSPIEGKQPQSMKGLVKQRFPGKSLQIVGTYDLPNNRSGSTFVVVEVQPTSSELSTFADYKVLVEDMFGVTGPIPINIMVHSETVNIPFGAIPGINSGFDVETEPDAIRVGLWITNNNAFSVFFDTVFDKVSSTFGGRLLVNFKVSIFVVFSDGSTGLWELNNRDELTLVRGSLRDSDGNVIPMTSNEADGLASLFPGGESNGNFVSTRDRVIAFGYSIGGSGGGSCTIIFRCDDDSCTATCRLH